MLPPLLSGSPPRRTALSARVRSHALVDALRTFDALCTGGDLPSPAALLEALAPLFDNMFVIEIDAAGASPTFRLLSLGRTLVAHVASAPDALLPSFGVAEPGSAGTQFGAYARAARAATPTYEFLRMSFGDEPGLSFERLLLPAADDGRNISHLVGVALIWEEVQPKT